MHPFIQSLISTTDTHIHTHTHIFRPDTPKTDIMNIRFVSSAESIDSRDAEVPLSRMNPAEIGPRTPLLVTERK